MNGIPGVQELDPVLMNPKRFLIATLLYMLGPRQMAFLQKALKLKWGDLYTHLNKLEKEGYIKTIKLITAKGPITLVKLTEKGTLSYEKLLNNIGKIKEQLYTREENPV